MRLERRLFKAICCIYVAFVCKRPSFYEGHLRHASYGQRSTVPVSRPRIRQLGFGCRARSCGCGCVGAWWAGGREIRLCDPCVCVRPCVPCVSRLPTVSFPYPTRASSNESETPIGGSGPISPSLSTAPDFIRRPSGGDNKPPCKERVRVTRLQCARLLSR